MLCLSVSARQDTGACQGCKLVRLGSAAPMAEERVSRAHLTEVRPPEAACRRCGWGLEGLLLSGALLGAACLLMFWVHGCEAVWPIERNAWCPTRSVLLHLRNCAQRTPGLSSTNSPLLVSTMQCRGQGWRRSIATLLVQHMS